jgi:hypothetical protein
MPGVKGKSGGKRPGAGRKPTKRTKSIELSEEATRDLLRFMDDLNLDPGEAGRLVSTLVSDALGEHGDEWREVFGNTLRSRLQDAPAP